MRAVFVIGAVFLKNTPQWTRGWLHRHPWHIDALIAPNFDLDIVVVLGGGGSTQASSPAPPPQRSLSPPPTARTARTGLRRRRHGYTRFLARVHAGGRKALQNRGA